MIVNGQGRMAHDGIYFNCLEKDSLRDSYAIAETAKQGKKEERATGAISRKWDSTATPRVWPKAFPVMTGRLDLA